VSDYCVKVFGVTTFGKIYGAVICLAGLFNFSQAFLDTLTFQWFGGDPRPANAILLSLTLAFGITLVVFLKGKVDEVRRNKAALVGEGSCHRSISSTYS